MTNIIEKQNKLQKEALKLLDKLKLLEYLSKFGKAEVVGSVALGLMTWRDIDIDVSVDELNDGDYFQAAKYLFKNPEVKRLILSDNRIVNEELKTQGIPASLYLGIITGSSGDGEWKIDIRFIKGSLIRAEKYIKETKSKLKEENRKTILKIKNTVCEHPKYINKEIFGVDIYDSVLDKGVKNIEEFKDYLANRGINF